MKNTKVYVDFITEKLKKLLSIDSPTGYTKDAIAWLKAEYEAMGPRGDTYRYARRHGSGSERKRPSSSHRARRYESEQCGDGKLRCHHKRRKTVRGLLPDEQPVDPCQRFLRPAGPHLRQYGGRSG